MSQDLVSTAPAAYTALYGLVVAAAAAYSTTPVQVFLGELLQEEPPAYVLIKGIENHRFQIEGMPYTFVETYSLTGYASYYQGNVDVGAVVNATYGIFQSVVQTPVISNRGQGYPILGITSGPSPFEVLPEFARYTGSPGMIGKAQAGFQGTVEWSFRCRGWLLPQ